MKIDDCRTLAEQLKDRHGLHDWKIGFTNTRRRLGGCHRTDKLISLRNGFVTANDEPLVKDVILHEIAHALTEGGHTRQWKQKARELGCSDRCLTRVYKGEVETSEEHLPMSQEMRDIRAERRRQRGAVPRTGFRAYMFSQSDSSMGGLCRLKADGRTLTDKIAKLGFWNKSRGLYYLIPQEDGTYLRVVEGKRTV